MSGRSMYSRRDFLKALGVGIGTGGVILGCARSVDLTETFVHLKTAAPVDGTADMIFTNGTVLTVDAANSITQAVAVKGDRILYAGSDRDVEALAGDQTKRINLQGRAITPGLIDPHLHFRVWGLQNSYYTPFMPPDVKDIPSLQAALADYLKGLQPGEWVMGYYIGLTDKMIPTREDLDPVSRDNPVFIMHIGGHWGTANSTAMQIAGITDNTSSPEGGIIEKADGVLTGVFYNHRAMDVVRVYAPAISQEQIKTAILDTQKAMAACGITGFHDNNVRSVEDIRTYQQISQEGLLYLRNDLYLTLEWPSDLDKVPQVQPMDDAVTRFAGYKFLIDGQGPTSYCHQPHTGVEYRLPTWDPDQFKEVVRSMHDTGLQICVHCIGDAATNLTLDAYEAAMNANPRPDPRHRIEHAILTTAAATTRMKDLGVAVCTQPAFIYLFGEGWEGLYGAERMERILVTREWLDAGVHLSISSDAPSTPLYYPQATLAGAISRYSMSGKVIGAEQALNFTEALRAHTIEGAYAGHHEDTLGSIEPGKYADLVVWPGDPSRMSLTELAQCSTVDMTLVGGKVVYEAS